MEMDKLDEFKVLEFAVSDRYYGINVAKVREIITYRPVTSVPNVHPSVEGVFMPRDHVITAIDLRNCLQLGISEPRGYFIVTNFNAFDLAFHVDDLAGMHTVSWADVMEPSSSAGNVDEILATGIIKIDNRLVIMLDLEKIIANINPEIGLKMQDVNAYLGRDRIHVPILLAEDSPLLNRMIVDSLEKAGYTNITHTENGKHAWDTICRWVDEGSLDSHVQCVITDIEMPKMDGHQLTRLIKSDGRTERIKVVIFSSLINDDMRKKGTEMGADLQLTKPEIGQLVDALDQLLGVAAQ